MKTDPVPTISHDTNYQSLDLDLVRRIRAGDEDAFETLFRMFYLPLCKFVLCFRPLDPSAAEEIVQELLAKVWARRERWKPANGVRAYLFKAARNRALNEVRRRRSVAHTAEQCVVQGETPGMGNHNPDPAVMLTIREVEAKCRQALGLLPESNRLAMALRWLYRMEHAEIAFVLDTSIKGVEKHITRGLRSLSLNDSLASLRA